MPRASQPITVGEFLAIVEDGRKPGVVQSRVLLRSDAHPPPKQPLQPL
jgi:hypothetical protein